VRKIFCLGSGYEEFKHYETYPSLSDLVHAIMQTAARGDQVLFSPSGASFDLFANYKERGDSFKAAVTREINRFTGFSEKGEANEKG